MRAVCCMLCDSALEDLLRSALDRGALGALGALGGPMHAAKSAWHATRASWRNTRLRRRRQRSGAMASRARSTHPKTKEQK
jgi:hypothetical protein